MAGLMAYPTIAVLRADDLARAKEFYVNVLGYAEDPAMSMEGMAFFSAGMGTKFTVYERPGMPAPQNTVMAIGVPNTEFDMVAEELRGKGVMFEDYDIPEIGLKTVNGIADYEGAKSAWFKDPEGNILNIVSM